MLSETAPPDRKPLTICAIGHADSVHVAARVRCFAEMGHRVYIITETPSAQGITGVTELVPGLDPRLAGQLWLRAVRWCGRRLGRRSVDHAWGAIGLIRLRPHSRPDIIHGHFPYTHY